MHRTNLLRQRFQISLMNLHQNWLKCLGLKARGGIIDIPHLQWAARGSSPKWLLSHGLLLLCPSFLILPPKSVAFWSRRSPSRQSGLAVPLSLTLSLRYKPQPQISQGWLNSEVCSLTPNPDSELWNLCLNRYLSLQLKVVLILFLYLIHSSFSLQK